MARIFITGSADGLGRAAAETLLEDGHVVIGDDLGQSTSGRWRDHTRPDSPDEADVSD